MIEWIKDTKKYSNGYIGNIGKIKNAFYIGSDNSGKGNWVLSTNLPGIKFKDPILNTAQDGNEMAEEALRVWMHKAGLTLKRIK